MLSALYWDASPTDGLQAGNGTWSASDECWNTASNGLGTRVAWTDGSDAVFSISGPSTITVSGAVSVNSVTFSGSGYTVSGEALTLNGVGSVVASAPATIASDVTGTAGLTKTGYGLLTLTGDNTYSGGTTLTAGALSISRDANIGGASSAITFSGGTLQVTGAELHDLNSHSVNWSNVNGGLDIADEGNTFTLSQSMGVGGTLSKGGSGILVLGGSESIHYATGVQVNGGTLRIDGGTVMGSVNNWSGAQMAMYGGFLNGAVWNSGAITINGGTVRGVVNNQMMSTFQIDSGILNGNVTGYSTTVKINGGTVSGNVTGYQWTVKINGGIVISGEVGGYSATVIINGGDISDNTLISGGTEIFGGDEDMVYSGTINNGTVVKQGAGKLTLTGSHNYSGGNAGEWRHAGGEWFAGRCERCDGCFRGHVNRYRHGHGAGDAGFGR